MTQPKPRLTAATIDSLDKLVKSTDATTYLGTDLELGMAWIANLIRHHRSPEATSRRRQNSDRQQQYGAKRVER